MKKMPVRIINSLKKAGLNSPEDVVSSMATGDLMKIRNIGQKAKLHIIQWLVDVSNNPFCPHCLKILSKEDLKYIVKRPTSK